LRPLRPPGLAWSCDRQSCIPLPELG
jgi:hypothetical protein